MRFPLEELFVTNLTSASVYDLALRPPRRQRVCGVGPERFERAPFDGAGMGGGEVDARRDAGVERLLPPGRAQAPAVAGLEAARSRTAASA